MIPTTPQRLNWSQRLSYAAPAFALAAVGLPIFIYIPKFYTDVVGVNVSIFGVIFLAVRTFDAITDPLMGVISDRSRFRWGRRRPYIAYGSIPLGISIWMLYAPPHTLNEFGATIWLIVSVFLLFSAWTAVTVPYESLGLELSEDYDERTTILGIREALLFLGTLLAVASPPALAAIMGLEESQAGERDRYFWFATLYGPAVILTCWLCALKVRERSAPIRPTESITPQSAAHVLKNRPFRILLLSYTVSAFGSTLPATLLPYYVTYVLRSDKIPLYLLSYFVTGVVCLPVWVRLSNKLGKKTTWLIAMSVNTLPFSLVPLLRPGDEWGYGLIVVACGLAAAAVVAIPSSMQADVLDYDEMMTGQRREGQYMGLWSISKKLSAALGVGLALPTLDLVGYVPNVAQTPQVLFVLTLLYVAVPVVCNVIAIFLALPYPIDRKEHAEIRQTIQTRKNRS